MTAVGGARAVVPEQVEAPVLEARSLRLGYGPRVVVEQLDLVIGRGECVALVGANGAGKSTSLKAISGLQPLIAGEVRYRGESVSGWSSVQAVQRGVVLCPEGRHLFPAMSVRDNLRLGVPRRIPAAEFTRRLDEVQGLFPVLLKRRGQLAGTLSGGEQQMVALGRALMSDPTVLILDEPSLGLSPLLIEQVFEAVRALVSPARSVLIAEQNVEASLAISDRAYVIETGAIVSEGPSSDLFERPELLKAFLG